MRISDWSSDVCSSDLAEAAPDSLDRFFYYEDVKSRDFLFLGVIDALNPALKEAYLSSGRNSDVKKIILDELKATGIYLIDLYQLPVFISDRKSTRLNSSH